MRHIFCCRCGIKTMNLENGSSVKAGTKTICVDCTETWDSKVESKTKREYDPKDPNSSYKAVDDLLNLFGMKR